MAKAIPGSSLVGARWCGARTASPAPIKGTRHIARANCRGENCRGPANCPSPGHFKLRSECRSGSAGVRPQVTVASGQGTKGPAPAFSSSEFAWLAQPGPEG